MKHIFVVLITIGAFLTAQGFDYVGSEKCKSCHKKEEKGAQYQVWESSAHAKALETLKSEKAIATAKAKGIKGNPWESPACLKCHTTGFGTGGYELKDKAFWNPAADDREGEKAVKRMAGLEGIGCEACHGPGSEYKSSSKMKAIFAGETTGAEFGFVKPNEKTCLKCHNSESPSFKGFDFKTYFEKIKHPYPDGYK